MIKYRKMKIYNIHRLIILVSLMSLGISCSNNDSEDCLKQVPAVERKQFTEHAENKRNLRYGEVIPIFREGTNLRVEVYNTLGSNELPQELWDQLDATSMAEEYCAARVILNGPRYFVMNQIEGKGKTANGKVADFGGIEMTLRATLESSVFKGTVGDKFYQENEVNRETTFYYWKGNMVYELVAPTGDVYRMQSYTLMVDPNLTIDQLENLGDKLKLPEGWGYRASILEGDSKMVADGIAYVINDNLGNSYQKITE